MVGRKRPTDSYGVACPAPYRPSGSAPRRMPGSTAARHRVHGPCVGVALGARADSRVGAPRTRHLHRLVRLTRPTDAGLGAGRLAPSRIGAYDDGIGGDVVAHDRGRAIGTLHRCADGRCLGVDHRTSLPAGRTSRTAPGRVRAAQSTSPDQHGALLARVTWISRFPCARTISRLRSLSHPAVDTWLGLAPGGASSVISRRSS